MPVWASSPQGVERLVFTVLTDVSTGFALFVPLVFLVLMVGFLMLAGWALPRLWRGVQGGFRGMATHMVSRFARSRHD